jgi:hypothetical protein
MPQAEIRAALLSVISELEKGGGGGNMQSSTALSRTAERLGINRNPSLEQAVLTQFGELFRTGHLAWGLNFSNPNPPFFHLTEQGLRTLSNFSSDPSNPAGYLKRVDTVATISPISKSYLVEALACFVADLNKAAAVMVGASAEGLIIELRDTVSNKLVALKKTAPKDLADWRASKILLGLKTVLDQQKNQMPGTLREKYEAYWPAFTQQIRTARNEAGHPASIEPVTQATVHASLLIFPELLGLTAALSEWTKDHLK